jgi:hypothetical protein
MFAIELLPIDVYDTSGAGTSFDLKKAGLDGDIVVIINSDKAGSGATIKFGLKESDNNSDFTLVENGIFKTVDNNGSLTESKEFSLSSIKRYVQISYEVTGTVTGYATAILMGHKKELKQSQWFLEKGTGVFGFSYVPEMAIETINFTEATAGKVNSMSDASWTAVITDVEASSDVWSQDEGVTNKSTVGFDLVAAPGKLYDIIITGTISS